MRPFTALSPDGLSNFYQAVSLAVSPEAVNRGALIALNDRIVSAYWASKTNANTLDTFKASEQGYLGTFSLNGAPCFFNTPSQPTEKKKFNIDVVSRHSYPSLPRVDMLYTGRGFDPDFICIAVKKGARGIILAAPGNGNIDHITEAAVDEAIDSDVRVVVATRTSHGSCTPQKSRKYTTAGYLLPNQARTQLQLAIASGYSIFETKQLFEGTARKLLGQELV